MNRVRPVCHHRSCVRKPRPQSVPAVSPQSGPLIYATTRLQCDFHSPFHRFRPPESGYKPYDLFLFFFILEIWTISMRGGSVLNPSLFRVAVTSRHAPTAASTPTSVPGQSTDGPDRFFRLNPDRSRAII